MKFQTKTHIEEYLEKRINYLTVKGVNPERARDGSIQWDFLCICGKIVTAPPYRVISEHLKSCGCMRYRNIKRKPSTKPSSPKIDIDSFLGKKSNHLTVVGVAPDKKGKRFLLDCVCDCGKHKYVLPYQFLNGAVKSCGCIMNQDKKTHGYSKHPLYGEWFAMVNRCYNPKSSNYERYGGRGITVCDEWKNSPENFIKWVEENGGHPPRTTLDRINNEKGYSPDNCRWANIYEQQNNTRANIRLEVKGEIKTMAEWCRLYGINAETLRGRLKRGWEVEKAITTPTNKSMYHRKNPKPLD